MVGVGGVGVRAAAVWRGGTETLDVASEIFAVVREPATYSSISSLPDRRYRNVAAASATSSMGCACLYDADIFAPLDSGSWRVGTLRLSPARDRLESGRDRLESGRG